MMGGQTRRAESFQAHLPLARARRTGTRQWQGERRSLSEADYADLITAGHNRLAGPVIVIWDNLNTHVSAVMGEFTRAHPDWLTVVQLPAYAPDLNPVEGVWANMNSGLGNLAAGSADQLARVVRNRLKRMQYQPALIDGFLAQTGLTLGPGPPWTPGRSFKPV